jgi:hypothetical protein
MPDDDDVYRPQVWPKHCNRCQKDYTAEEWLALDYVGESDDEYVEVLELRNCTCLSTLAITVRPTRKSKKEKARSLRTKALKYNDLVALADKLAVKDVGLRHMLREVPESRWKTHEFLGSSRAPSFSELLDAVEKAGREQGLW